MNDMRNKTGPVAAVVDNDSIKRFEMPEKFNMFPVIAGTKKPAVKWTDTETHLVGDLPAPGMVFADRKNYAHPLYPGEFIIDYDIPYLADFKEGFAPLDPDAMAAQVDLRRKAICDLVVHHSAVERGGNGQEPVFTTTRSGGFQVHACVSNPPEMCGTSPMFRDSVTGCAIEGWMGGFDKPGRYFLTAGSHVNDDPAKLKVPVARIEEHQRLYVASKQFSPRDLPSMTFANYLKLMQDIAEMDGLELEKPGTVATNNGFDVLGVSGAAPVRAVAAAPKSKLGATLAAGMDCDDNSITDVVKAHIKRALGLIATDAPSLVFNWQDWKHMIVLPLAGAVARGTLSEVEARELLEILEVPGAGDTSKNDKELSDAVRNARERLAADEPVSSIKSLVALTQHVELAEKLATEAGVGLDDVSGGLLAQLTALKTAGTLMKSDKGQAEGAETALRPLLRLPAAVAGAAAAGAGAAAAGAGATVLDTAVARAVDAVLVKVNVQGHSAVSRVAQAVKDGAEWVGGVSAKGVPTYNDDNVVEALMRLGVICESDVRSDGDLLLTVPRDVIGASCNRTPLTDATVLALGHTVSRRFGRKIKKLDMHEALVLMGRAAPVDMFRNYLDGLKWDGTPRICNMPAAFRVEDSDFNLAAFKLWMVALVMVTYRPGCGFGAALMLVGKEGTGKTTACKILTGSTTVPGGGDLFASASLKDISSPKQFLEAIGPASGVEIAELDAAGHKMWSFLKSLLTGGKAKARLAYDKSTTTHQLRNLFLITTNDRDALPTGQDNRRFWVVDSDLPIALDWLQEAVLQLHAEAVHMWRNEFAEDPANVKLPETLYEAAHEATKQASQADELVVAAIEGVMRGVAGVGGVTFESSPDIEEHGGVSGWGMGTPKFKAAVDNRLGEKLDGRGWQYRVVPALKQMGFKRVRAATETVGETRPWCWFRPNS